MQAVQAAQVEGREAPEHGLYAGLLGSALLKQAVELILKIKERALAEFAQPPGVGPAAAAGTATDADGSVIAECAPDNAVLNHSTPSSRPSALCALSLF